MCQIIELWKGQHYIMYACSHSLSVTFEIMLFKIRKTEVLWSCRKQNGWRSLTEVEIKYIPALAFITISIMCWSFQGFSNTPLLFAQNSLRSHYDVSTRSIREIFLWDKCLALLCCFMWKGINTIVLQLTAF